MHDPRVYDDPDDFRPERFIKDGMLDTDVLDQSAIVFGAGRRHVIPISGKRHLLTLSDIRICPGRYFAQSSLLLNIASVLHVRVLNATDCPVPT